MYLLRLLTTVACCGIVLSLGVPPQATAALRREPAETGRASSGVRYRWPLERPGPVLRRFDPPPEPWLPGHRGVDLGGAPGEPVLATGAGTVHYAGVVAGIGVVSVAHPDGLLTTYQPVRSTLVAGIRVGAGDTLGLLESGHRGCPAPTCLHWGLRKGGVYLDPLALLGPVRARLLPLG